MDSVDYTSFQAENAAREDEKLLVKFYWGSTKDRAASAEAGRPIFKDVEFVDIRAPGQKDSVCRPARASDKERFPRHWQAFQNRTELPLEGTPLAEWPGISRGEVESLSFLEVKTVEQLANMPDNAASEMMGMMSLKQRAKDFIERAKEGAPSAQLVAALEERDVELTALKTQNDALLKRLEALEQQQLEKQEPQVVAEVKTATPVEIQTALDLDDGSEEDTPASPPQTRRRRRRTSDEE